MFAPKDLEICGLITLLTLNMTLFFLSRLGGGHFWPSYPARPFRVNCYTHVFGCVHVWNGCATHLNARLVMRNAIDKGSISTYHSLGLGRSEFESGSPGPFVYPVCNSSLHSRVDQYLSVNKSGDHQHKKRVAICQPCLYVDCHTLRHSECVADH